MKNKYANRTKITEAKFRQVVKCFALDLTAIQTTEMVGLNRNTINRLYAGMRRRIAEYSRKNAPVVSEAQADDGSLEADCEQSRRGRGAAGKTTAFGLYKRDGKVYTEIIPNAKAAAIQAVFRGYAEIEAFIRTEWWHSYDVFVDLGYETYFRVRHGEEDCSCGNHINGIESFWGYAKHRLTKFKGSQKPLFELYLKETEFRFNHAGSDLYKILLKLFREAPLF